MPAFIARDDRDPGVTAAVEAAGGLNKLALLLGMRNPSVLSRWKRVPAERAAEVERLTGVPRSTLRPDLFGDAEPLPLVLGTVPTGVDGKDVLSGKVSIKPQPRPPKQPARWFAGKKI